MKKLTIEFFKSSGKQEKSKIFTRVIQEVGITEGVPPKHGAFFEDGFEKLFTGFIAIEGYLLAFMDQNMENWLQRDPGVVCTLTFNEDDFKGEKLDDAIVMQKMSV